MAKIPKPPKPKLPKPKKSLGQHLKDNTRKAAASGLRKNFGVLGEAVAKKYLASPRVKTRIRTEPDTGNKKIDKKKLKTTVTPDLSILESAKQVTQAVEVVATNASRGFTRASRQVDTMGVEVTKAMTELSGILDRMLYRKPAVAPAATAPTGPQRVETPEAEGGGLPWWLRILPLAGVLLGTFGMRRTTKQKEDMYNADINKYGRSKADTLKRTRNWGITGWLNNKLDDAFEMFSGSSSQTGKKEIGGGENIIHKMKYTADKIKFVSTGKIEFKSKLTSSQTSGTPPAPASGGFFNRMIDKMTGGPGGGGFFNSLGDKLIGGKGGGGYAGGGGMDNKGGGPPPNTGRTTSVPVKPTDVAPQTSTSIPSRQGGSAGAVDRAEKLLGKNETVNNADIQQYLKSGGAGMDPAKAAWCAAFVNSSLQQSGVTGTNSQAAGSFQKWGQSVAASEIRKGDVLVNKKVSPRTGMVGSHVGFATGNIDPKTGKIEIISGNANHPGDGGGDVHHDWVDPASWNARRATEKEDPELGSTRNASKWLDIPPELNKQMSKEPNISDTKPRRGWRHMRHQEIEDRRGQADPNDDDQYSIATMEQEGMERITKEGWAMKRDDSTFIPSPLGYALGGKNIAEMGNVITDVDAMKQQNEVSSWKALEPPDTVKPSRIVVHPQDHGMGSSNDKLSPYEGTRDDLDHRPRQDAAPDTDFSSYMDVK